MDLITPIVAGAAGAFIKQLGEKGVNWLIQLVGSHSQTVQAQAKANLENFLIRLAKRVEVLEAELPASERQVFEEALSHPSLSLLLQKSMVSAASTESEDRHTILSELIAQRLSAGADDMIALVGAAACDIVNALSSKHIRLLGLIARLLSIRPIGKPEFTEQGEYDKYLLTWWAPLATLCEGLEGVNELDLRHLAGLSCITISVGARQLYQLFALAVVPSAMEPTMTAFEAEAWWGDFKRIWDVGLGHVSLTTLGELIGVLYHDSQLKSETVIPWE